jgi:hypothetical protein
MSTGAVVARILTQYSDKGSKQAQKDIAKLGKQIDAFGKKAAKSFKIAIVATAALSVKIGKDAVEAAIEDSKSQLVLANAMRNTTGATQQAIDSAEAYIEKTMFRVNVADEQLRASLATLFIATGDLTQAQKLQTIALDVSAATGKDLASATVAITRAQQGNVTSLKKLSPELSGLISQGMKAEEVFLLLEAAYGGSAEALADLDPLTKLKLQYGEVLETLGTELLPVVAEFVDIIEKDILPAVEAWIKANGGELREGIRNLVDIGLSLIKTFGDLAKFYNKYDWVIKLAFSMFALGKAFKLINYVARPLSGILKTLESTGGGLAGAFKKLVEIFAKVFLKFTSKADSKEFAGLFKIFERLAKVVGTLTGGFIALGTAGIAASNGLKDLFGIDAWPWEKSITASAKAVERLNDASKVTANGPFAETIKKANDAAAKAKLLADARAKAAAEAAKEAIAAAKTAKAEKLREDVLKRLSKLNAKPGTGKASIGGVVPTSTREAAEQEAINFRAAELLLLKQKDNQAELQKLKDLKENILLQGIRNTLSERYKDILTALADAKIDSKDIATLAGKWGVTIEAAKAYIETIFAISDGTISDDEVVELAKSWGSTKEQAAKYLDFFTYLNDGILSDAEIEKLRNKWGMTEAQVRQYADFVAVVNDGKLDDSEVKKLMDKWKLTSDEVVDYILKIGSPVSYSDTLISPARAAEIAWKSATAALEAYLRLLGQGAVNGSKGGFTYDPAASADANKEAADAAAAAADAAKEASEATDAATAAALEAANAVMKIAAEIEATSLKIASGKKFLTDSQMDQVLTTAGSPYAPGMNDSAAFADERSRFQQKYGISPTMATASTIGTSSSSSPVVVNLTVNGSVSTEQDLVQAVRQGLLGVQTNGNSITLQAI